MTGRMPRPWSPPIRTRLVANPNIVAEDGYELVVQVERPSWDAWLVRVDEVPT